MRNNYYQPREHNTLYEHSITSAWNIIDFLDEGSDLIWLLIDKELIQDDPVQIINKQLCCHTCVYSLHLVNLN